MIAGSAATIHPEKPILDGWQTVGKRQRRAKPFGGPVDIVKKNHRHGF